jgi:hypothetical protein
MKRLNFLAVAIALSMLLTGCTRALLFNNGLLAHTTEPLTFNKDPTEIRKCELDARGRINQFQDPFVSAISVRLGENGLADVAKAHGITTIYYADIERWSALFGLWSSDVVHIYGR